MDGVAAYPLVGVLDGRALGEDPDGALGRAVDRRGQIGRASMDETLMIEPPPARRMAGMARRVPRKTPLVFTAMTSSHSSSDVSSMDAPRAMPALFTKMSSLP